MLFVVTMEAEYAASVIIIRADSLTEAESLALGYVHGKSSGYGRDWCLDKVKELEVEGKTTIIFSQEYAE